QDAAAPATEPAPAATDAPATAPVADAQATAAPAEAAAVTGDATRGKGLTYTCRGCHGIEGYKNAYPSYKVPKIGGQSQAYLNAALTEYRNGNRKHPTMQAQAQSFSEQDIADIAAYLSSLK
ncbi:MAG: cytochrome c, partial [Xanthomonadales bacterium]|nr:cytochrome c [Xanthomonadales bacterium]